MREGRIAPAKLGEWIQDLSVTEMWLGLGSASPFDVDDPLTVEIDGPVYRRPKASWQRAAPTLLRSGGLYRWTGLLPGTRVTGIIGWDGAYNGEPVIYCPLPDALAFPAGGTYTLPAGELYVGLDI